MTDPDRISAMFGPDSLRAHIYGQRADATRDFDARNRDLVGVVEKDLANVYLILFWTVIYGGTLGPGRSMEALALFNRASETIVSAFHLVRQRATHEGIALLRIAIEAASSAVHITEDPNAWAEFNTLRLGRYKATHAVRYAKKHVCQVHEFYTRLSQVYLHANRFAFGSLPGNGNGPQLTIGNREADHEEDIVALITVSVAAGMVLKMMETVLLAPDPADPDILVVPGSSRTVRPTADRVIADRYATIEKLWSNG